MALGFNPDDVWKPAGRAFAQAVPARQGRVVHVTGQVALDDAGRLVGAGDVDRQFRASVENIERILLKFGGRLSDVVSLTVLFSHREDLPVIQAVWSEFFRTPNAPVSITFQVAGFVYPEHRIELVPIAVIPVERYRDPITNPNLGQGG